MALAAQNCLGRNLAQACQVQKVAGLRCHSDQLLDVEFQLLDVELQLLDLDLVQSFCGSACFGCDAKRLSATARLLALQSGFEGFHMGGKDVVEDWQHLTIQLPHQLHLAALQSMDYFF